MSKKKEIRITPEEQQKLKDLGWEGMIRKALAYNPNEKKKKGKK